MSLNEVFNDLMVLASLCLPVDSDDVNDNIISTRTAFTAKQHSVSAKSSK